MGRNYKARYFAFFVTSCVILILTAILKFDVQKDVLKTQWWPKMADKNNSARTQRRKTVVLVYTPFFGNRNWVPVSVGKRRCGSDKHNQKQCSLDNFELTYDKTRFSESDMVVFHARDMPSLTHLRSLLNSRPTSQRWVYALWESPNATPDTRPLNGLFNLTWTYRTDADFWTPYGKYQKISQEDMKTNEMATLKDYTQEKTELVAWIVSNCNPQLRISFVRELKKHIKVAVFGDCSHLFGESRICRRPATRNCIKNYKFYLSFENALCKDYITEKYWGNLGKHFLSFLIYLDEASTQCSMNKKNRLY